MIMKIARYTFIVFLLLSFVLPGCARRQRAPEEASTTSFTNGVLQATHQNTLFRTFEATRATVQDQGMAITDARRKKNIGSINAVLGDGTTVNIALRARQPDQTEIGIKVGAYGSEELSREINRGIETRLRNSN
jgi:hypothetical protein